MLLIVICTIGKKKCCQVTMTYHLLIDEKMWLKNKQKKTVPGTGSKGIYLECIKLGFTSQGSRIKTGLISQRISKARPGQWTRELICHVARAWKMSYD